MATKKQKPAKKRKPAKKQRPAKKAVSAARVAMRTPAARVRTNAREFLEQLNGGPLTFGQLINTARLCEEASLDAFAKRLGVSRAYLCDVEKGRRPVSVERAAEWARKIGGLESQYVALALQADVNAAGLKFVVRVERMEPEKTNRFEFSPDLVQAVRVLGTATAERVLNKTYGAGTTNSRTVRWAGGEH